MKRSKRSPHQIGLIHGRGRFAPYTHRHLGRRYDSANANESYMRGYYEGIRQRTDRTSKHYINLFDLAGVPAPRQSRPTR